MVSSHWFFRLKLYSIFLSLLLYYSLRRHHPVHKIKKYITKTPLAKHIANFKSYAIVTVDANIKISPTTNKMIFIVFILFYCY